MTDRFITAFWAKVQRGAEGECWPWTGYKIKSGHGLTYHKCLSMLTSRKAWVLTHGEIAEGLQVLHRCDNPACCNPGHLYLGTKADNMIDRFGKIPAAERCARGRPHALTREQIAELVQMRRDGKLLRDCAAHFGCHIATIARIMTERRKSKLQTLRADKLSAISR